MYFDDKDITDKKEIAEILNILFTVGEKLENRYHVTVARPLSTFPNNL